jgi:hypothetical protein
MPGLQSGPRGLDTLVEKTALIMHRSIKVAPPNSLVFVSDPDGGEPPVPVRDAMILSSPSCISVACYPEVDGETEITLGSMAEVDPGDFPSFTGTLETPNRAVVVSTVEQDTLLEARVPGTRTAVRVWLNHPRWPDKVTIGLD